ncbi:MAG TPA: DUF4232 domain-containing protein [Jatrophihabitans sp.]|nr:DUF4232 domain-containing protein [Jatrophihabitans sp.]
MATPASSTTAPRCVTSHLVVWMGVPGDGAAGSMYFPLEFTNIGSRACTLRGFPGVSAWAHGHRIGSPASWAHTVPTRTVTLKPRATAHTVLRVVDVGNFPRSACKAATATSIKVFPPNTRVARQISFRLRVCSVARTHSLAIQGPVIPRVGIPGH